MLQKTKISSTKPYEDELQNVLLDILKSHDHKMKKESVLRTDKNFNHYFAYRITQTPTLMRVLPLQLDDTNRAIRYLNKDNLKDFMVRISLTNEAGEKNHYSGQNMETLLEDQVKKCMKNGVKIG